MPVSRKNRNMKKSSRSRKILKSKNSRRSKRNHKTLRRMRGGNLTAGIVYKFTNDSNSIEYGIMSFNLPSRNVSVVIRTNEKGLPFINTDENNILEEYKRYVKTGQLTKYILKEYNNEWNMTKVDLSINNTESTDNQFVDLDVTQYVTVNPKDLNKLQKVPISKFNKIVRGNPAYNETTKIYSYNSIDIYNFYKGTIDGVNYCLDEKVFTKNPNPIKNYNNRNIDNVNYNDKQYKGIQVYDTWNPFSSEVNEKNKLYSLININNEVYFFPNDLFDFKLN
jgi:hypothetical protein